MAILNNLIVKGDTRFIGEAGGNFAGTFNGFDLQMAVPANASGEDGSEGLISSTDKRDLDKLIARVAGFATTAGAIDPSTSRCAAYTATISGIGTTLTAGTVIYIKMHAKSAANATLDVNNIGAKSIYWRTSAISNDKLGLNYIFMLVYDGTNWVIPYDYDTTYSAVSLGFGYGTCSTVKDTAAKTVSISNYSLSTGGIVAIKFTNGSNVANPTLNINSRGAKNIYYNGAAITFTNDYFVAGLTYLFVYDGIQYQLIGVNYDTNYGICSTAAGTAAKTVNVSEPFLKVTGAHVTVKFTITNTASSPTLNVNNTGAAAIYYRGAAISAGYLAANRTYEFVFNGTQYELIGDINTNITAATVDPSDVLPPDGTANKGTSTKYAREDHEHKLKSINENFTDNTTIATTLNYGSEFTVMNNVDRNSAGQVIAREKTKYKLPSVSQTVTNGDTKPVSGEAVYEYINTTLKGNANGLASLDANGMVPAVQLPSYVDDVIEGYIVSGVFYNPNKKAPHDDSTVYISANSIDDNITAGKYYKWIGSNGLEGFFETEDIGSVVAYAEAKSENTISVSDFCLSENGESNKIYVDINTNKTYRWSGSTYIEISESIALGTTSSTAYRGDLGNKTTNSFNLFKTTTNSSRNIYLSQANGSDIEDDEQGLSKSKPLASFNEVIKRFGYLSHINLYIDTRSNNNYADKHFYIYNFQTINIIGSNFAKDGDDPSLTEEELSTMGAIQAQVHVNSCSKVLFQNIKFIVPESISANNESTIDNKTYLVYLNYTQNVIFNNCTFTGNVSIGALYNSDSKVRIHNCTFNTFSNVYGIYNNSEVNSYANTGSNLTQQASVANSRFNSLNQDFNGITFSTTNSYSNNSLIHPNNVIQPISGGTGLGVSTTKDVANGLINALDTANSVPADNDYYISQYANGGTTNITYHRRPMSKLWDYIYSKMSNESLGNGYGTCSTEAATAAKVATLASYQFKKNGRVWIKFTNSIPANATLNINSKGAKDIYYKGAKITANVVAANTLCSFIYNGTQYDLIDIIPLAVTNTTASQVSLTHDGSLNVITGVATNDVGRVTSVTTTPLTLPADLDSAVQNTNNDSKKFYITGSESNTTNTSGQFFNKNIYVEASNNNFHVEGTINGAIPYGDCSTAAATAEKTVTVSGTFSLVNGARVAVRFTTTNSVDNPKLNVNNTGAKPIAYRGSAINKGYLATNRTYQFIYNSDLVINSITGAYEVLGDIDNNTTYTPQSLGFGYATCTTAETTTAKTSTLSNYSLITNGIVSVYFQYAVPANSTLNINSKGAKPIYYNGSAITDGIINAGDTATFIYDGTNYNLIAININIEAGIGLTETTSGTIKTIKANLKSETALTGAANNPSNTANRYYPVAVDSNNKLAVNIPWTDTKVTNTLNTTTKYNITGTTSDTTNTNTQIFDTGVYVGATAGELNSTTYKLNEAVTFAYNSTNQCVDFIFA